MTAADAVRYAMWACFDYAAPHPPEQAAQVFADKLDEYGFKVVAK